MQRPLPSWRSGSVTTPRTIGSTAIASHCASASTRVRSFAGIVRTHEFAYDLRGDVVSTASRMESEGVPGSIQVTPATYKLIHPNFICESRGVVSVNGKEDMRTYFLILRRT